MLSVLEMTKRCIELQDVGKKIGFDVDVNGDYYVWSSEIAGTYRLNPCADAKDCSAKRNEGDIISICLSEPDNYIKADNIIYLEDLKKLSDIAVDREHQVRILEYWKLAYGPCDLEYLGTLVESHIVNMGDKEKVKNNLKNIGEASEAKTEKNHKNTVKYDMTIFIKMLNDNFDAQFIDGESKTLVERKSDICILPLVSKEYGMAKNVVEYWYSVHSYQLAEMNSHKVAYYAFCMSTLREIVLIPRDDFDRVKQYFTTSPNNGDVYWHVKIRMDGKRYWLVTRREFNNIFLDEYPHIKVLGIVGKNQEVKVIKISNTNLHEITCKKKK